MRASCAASRANRLPSLALRPLEGARARAHGAFTPSALLCFLCLLRSLLGKGFQGEVRAAREVSSGLVVAAKLMKLDRRARTEVRAWRARPARARARAACACLRSHA